MLEIKENFPLKSLNTFGIAVKTKFYCKINSFDDAINLVRSDELIKGRKLIMGGGSNLLFTDDFPGLIIHPVIGGIDCIKEDAHEVTLKVGSGVEWDHFVEYCVVHDYGGIENLSGIPGNVGASPIQNIGAYGCEVEQVIDKVEGFDIGKKQFITYKHSECNFSYRNSIFKNAQKGNFLVCYVYFRLRKKPHDLITHYGNLAEKLSTFPKPDIAVMRKIILEVRASKLPDHKIVGNAGSFFKNPVTDIATAKKLAREHPDMPQFPAGDKIKLSAAWLIDRAGLKGYRMGNAATHDKQALVIVNTGNARGKEIADLAAYIQKVVLEKYLIVLEPEVNIL